MSHLDDGVLHALLDGEIDAAQARIVEQHLAGCRECAQRLDEARAFFSEADSLIGTLQVPASPATGTAWKPTVSRPPAARPWLPRLQIVAWAASVVLAVGIGFYASDCRRPAVSQAPVPLSPATPPTETPPSNSTDLARNEPAITVQEERGNRQERASQPLGGKVEVAGAGGEAERESARSDAPSAAAPPAQNGALAAAADRLVLKDSSPSRDEQQGRQAQAVAKPQPISPPVAEEKPAAKSRVQVQVLSADQVATIAEGQTGIVSGLTGPAAGFRRIVLEEAVGHLAGSIRLIEGMVPERVEIGPGSLVPGATPDADVVRVVYLDPPGRELLLDQQRVGQTADSGAGDFDEVGLLSGDTLATTVSSGAARIRWLDGQGFWLSLQGNIGVDSLKRIASQVH